MLPYGKLCIWLQEKAQEGPVEEEAAE